MIMSSRIIAAVLFAIALGLGTYAAAEDHAKQCPAKEIDSPRIDNSILETPWFSHSAVRQQLSIDDDQVDRLNRSYMKARDRYLHEVALLDPTLTDEERSKFQEELQWDFYKEFDKSVKSIVTDRRSLQRYNQLHLQHRGIAALNDPEVREVLKLTDEQRKTFSQLERDWNRRMAEWHRDYAVSPEQTLKRFNENRTDIQQGLKSALTPEQEQAWRGLTGEPYELPPEVYFQDGKRVRPFSR